MNEAITEALNVGVIDHRTTEGIGFELPTEEYEQLLQVVEGFGVDTHQKPRLTDKALGHNDGLHQLLRLAIQGNLDASTIEPTEPAVSLRTPDGARRIHRMRVTVPPKERSIVDASISESELASMETDYNTSHTSKAMRHGIIRPLLEEAFEDE
ncbi:hypothetical protein [Halococcus salsus]|uniref:hypothetical protein n=1 Tax=Halococcus salsus TaxID=2162894 RepID=UPI0013594B6A|nr:hypothetical protein [Halococcus salsus]